MGCSAKPKLKDLDPHLEISDGLPPTQQLHANWPDGLKRQVARHFYGMSPAQIRAEEEKERLRHHRRRSTKLPGSVDAVDGANGEQAAGATTDGANSASPRGSAIRGPEVLPHGLEIRIRNCEHDHSRTVVGRHTTRIRGKEESTARQTMLLGKIHAEAKKRFEQDCIL